MNSNSHAEFLIGRIDFARPFLPEHLTPLPYTDVFHQLPMPARLRYNQLMASCYHEHFIYLETMLAEMILPALIRRFAGEPVAVHLEDSCREERKHSAWFHELHRASEPELYRENRHHFVQVPRFAQRLLEFCARRPETFPFCLWITMIIEERTIPSARDLLREADRIEPHYVRLHRLHAADEAGHVSCDAEMLRRLWPELSEPGRAFNRFMFVTLLREFFRLPKRAGWRVIQHLAVEQPWVHPLLPRLRRELLALESDRAYLATLYSREREPRTFALADSYAELRDLEAALLGAAPATH
jgi:P-aminobenzoate N-oxygenase AurF